MTWITDRRPTEADANNEGLVLFTGANTVLLGRWQEAGGFPWQPAPDKYVKPVPVRHTGMFRYSQALPAVHGFEAMDGDPADWDVLLAAIDSDNSDPADWMRAVVKARQP